MWREPGSGSSDPDPSKKLIEMQNANNSGSGRGPDLRIIPKLMRMHMDPDSWIRIQEFLCGLQIRIGSVPNGTDPLLRIQSGFKLFMCKGNSASRASEWTREYYALCHLRSGPYHPGPVPPKLSNTILYYHFMVISWTHTVWKGIHSTPAHEFGTTVRMPRCLR